MRQYLSRIEVHLSSLPTTESVDTIIVADGQVMGSSSPNNNDLQWLQALSGVSMNGSNPSMQTLASTISQSPTNGVMMPDMLEYTNGRLLSRNNSTSSNSTIHDTFSDYESLSQSTSKASTPPPTLSMDQSMHRSSSPQSGSLSSFTDPFSGWFDTNSQTPFDSNDLFYPAPSAPHSATSMPSSSANDITMSDLNICSGLEGSSLFPTSSAPSPGSFGSTLSPVTSNETAISSCPMNRVEPIHTGVVMERTDAFSQLEEQTAKDVKFRAKRTKRLTTLVESLRKAPMPSMQEYNEKIRHLYNANGLKAAQTKNMSATNFAAALENRSDAPTSLSFVYGLLQWEIFRQEEERMARKEKLSPIAASKAANKQMVEVLNRRAKTRDWASDGRKAAKMVFDTLKHRSTTERSFAILLLAENVSLDCMLKVSHFPATRAAFASSFAQIVEGKVDRWNLLAENGYETFDYQEFLRTRGNVSHKSHFVPSNPTSEATHSENVKKTGDRETPVRLPNASDEEEAFAIGDVENAINYDMDMTMFYDFDIPHTKSDLGTNFIEVVS